MGGSNGKAARDESPVYQRLQPRDVQGEVLQVWLESCAALPIDAACAVRFSLEPGGGQSQRSSVRLERLRDPKWDPPERFEFVIDKTQEPRIHVEIVVAGEVVATAVLVVSWLVNDGYAHHNLSLVTENGTTSTDTYVTLTTRLMTKSQAFDMVEDLVWEYARLDREIELDVDPGRYSDESAEDFTMLFDDIAPKIPQGYEVAKSWSIVPTLVNKDGWIFSDNFRSDTWLDHGPSVVSRRRWIRHLRRSIAASAPVRLDDLVFHVRPCQQRLPPPPPAAPPGMYIA